MGSPLQLVTPNQDRQNTLPHYAPKGGPGSGFVLRSRYFVLHCRGPATKDLSRMLCKHDFCESSITHKAVFNKTHNIFLAPKFAWSVSVCYKCILDLTL